MKKISLLQFFIFIIILFLLYILIKTIDLELYKNIYKIYFWERNSENIEILKKYNTNNSKNVISVSLFGNKKYYIDCAFKMKEDIHKYFPNWELRVYIHYKMNRNIINRFINKGCQVIIIKQDNVTPSDSTFWRFLAAGDNVNFICRDVDYKLNHTDFKIVNSWLQNSNTKFIKYLNLEGINYLEFFLRGDILFWAGFWGGKPNCIPNILEEINNFKKRKHWHSDELFLEKIITKKYIEKEGILVILFNYKSKINKKKISKNSKFINIEGDSVFDYLSRDSLMTKYKKILFY